MSRLLLLDFDNTLVPVGHHYHEANQQCLELLEKEFGQDRLVRDEVLNIQYGIDRELEQVHDYHVSRFPNSWTMTYRRLLDQYGGSFNGEFLLNLEAAAKRFMDGPFVPYPGVPQALKRLSRFGDRLYLVTAAKNAEEFQQRKIDLAGLTRYFADHIVYTGFDKTEHFRSLLSGETLRGVVIGDSAKHDIVPGKAVGAWTVKVGNNSWTHTHADVTADFTVDHFREVPDLITNLPR